MKAVETRDPDLKSLSHHFFGHVHQERQKLTLEEPVEDLAIITSPGLWLESTLEAFG